MHTKIAAIKQSVSPFLDDHQPKRTSPFLNKINSKGLQKQIGEKTTEKFWDIKLEEFS